MISLSFSPLVQNKKLLIMADGKAAATGAPPSKAEDDAEYCAGVQAIKTKNYSTVKTT